VANQAVLSSSRTIDRRVVHRTQVHEVFLTDVDEAGECFMAQLPSTHGYFCDGVASRLGMVDILTLMEACRQAATAAAHLFWGVAYDRQFILTRWVARFPAATRPRYSLAPVDLRLHVYLERPRRARGELTGGTTRVTVHSSAAGDPIVGTLELDIRYVRGETYQFLRESSRRGGPLPSSASWLPESEAADPLSVGCTREDNVAIRLPVVTGHGGHAGLRPPFRNRSMFDHPQDHVPAMVLVEAARQLAHATTPSAPPRSTVTSAHTSNSITPPT
jgi:2-oxo-3-(phosphooxy)propyl 3-oxoalkanoate synthase